MEERQGVAPRGLIAETMAYGPDELAGELGGVADHFLSRNALPSGAGLTAGRLPTRGFLLPDAGVFQRGEQEGEEVVREGAEVGVGGCGGATVGPGFLLV